MPLRTSLGDPFDLSSLEPEEILVMSKMKSISCFRVRCVASSTDVIHGEWNAAGAEAH